MHIGALHGTTENILCAENVLPSGEGVDNMTEAAFNLMRGLLNQLSNAFIINNILANLKIAATLLVRVIGKLRNTSIFSGSQQAVRTRLCLIAAVLLFTQLGLVGHNYHVNQSGIMLAAPTEPAFVILAYGDEHLLIETN